MTRSKHTQMMTRTLMLRGWDWLYITILCSWFYMSYYILVTTGDVVLNMVPIFVSVVFLLTRMASTELVLFWWVWASSYLNLLGWFMILLSNVVVNLKLRGTILTGSFIIGIYLFFALGSAFSSAIERVTRQTETVPEGEEHDH